MNLSQITVFQSLVTSDTQMLNVHLGVPGLAPDLLQSLAVCDRVQSEDGLYFVTSEKFRALFRDSLKAKPGTSAQESKPSALIEDFTHVIRAFDTVAISQHNFFGFPEDALRQRKSFPLAESRLKTFSELLGPSKTTFHITICSQIEYILKIRRLSKADRLEAIRNAQFSWSELMFRIRRGAPDREFVVWDFDHPRATALPFSMWILGIEIDDLKQNVLEAIQSEFKPRGSDYIDYTDRSLAGAVARLDERYEIDLDEIGSMQGVKLVRREAIPIDLHL